MKIRGILFFCVTKTTARLLLQCECQQNVALASARTFLVSARHVGRPQASKKVGKFSEAVFVSRVQVLSSMKNYTNRDMGNLEALLH